MLSQHHAGLEDIDPSEEVTDTEDNDEEDLGVLDDQRSIILHLLSQLKLGMDLTRVRTNRPSGTQEDRSSKSDLSWLLFLGGAADLHFREALAAGDVR